MVPFNPQGNQKTICLIITTARKLAAYTCLCINCHNIKGYRKLYYPPLNSVKMVPSAKLAVISETKGETSLTKKCLGFRHLYIIIERVIIRLYYL